METKIFGGKKIEIRKLSKNDLRNVKKSLEFFNSLVKEDAQILFNNKNTLKKEKEWLSGQIKKVQENKLVFIIAEDDKNFIGTAEIYLGPGRREHIGHLGINIRKGYRGMGLGSYLMKKIITLAKKELKPKPQIIRLNTLVTNQPAIGLYKKCGFKKVAIIPKQFEYKGKLRDEILMLLYLRKYGKK